MTYKLKGGYILGSSGTYFTNAWGERYAARAIHICLRAKELLEVQFQYTTVVGVASPSSRDGLVRVPDAITGDHS